MKKGLNDVECKVLLIEMNPWRAIPSGVPSFFGIMEGVLPLALLFWFALAALTNLDSSKRRKTFTGRRGGFHRGILCAASTIADIWLRIHWAKQKQTLEERKTELKVKGMLIRPPKPSSVLTVPVTSPDKRDKRGGLCPEGHRISNFCLAYTVFIFPFQ